jgi:UDP-N-acetylmuramate--alanine ligase
VTHGRRIHFIGIGGSGMSGIARILLRSGYVVSGSDLRENAETEALRAIGAKVFRGHDPRNLEEAESVVYSSAVSADNPELAAARERRLPVFPRGEMLAELARKKRSIVVAGAHGKTTTSAMIATLLMESGFDPTTVIGGRLRSISGNAKVGTDEWFVCESDESDGSFLKLLPEVAVVTNVDREHLNHYGTMEKLEEAFERFAGSVPFDGTAVICRDDPRAAQLAGKIRKPVITYGINSPADILARAIEPSAGGTRFELREQMRPVCVVDLPVRGKHNVLNALAAAAVGLHLGLSGERIAAGLAKFGGIDRRLEVKGQVARVTVIDDYAHHPTEIRASLEALRSFCPKGSLRVLFQPHRYSRLRDLWDEFLTAFGDADDLVVAPVYGAGESAVPGISSERLVQALGNAPGLRVEAAPSLEEGARALAVRGNAGDVLVTMGAGDVTKAAASIVKHLEARKPGGTR